MFTYNSSRTKSYTTEMKSIAKRYPCTVDDPAWLHFLADSRSWLIQRSTIVTVTEAMMLRYAYRIRDYLADQRDCNVGCEQAFRVINRLGSDLDFNSNLNFIYVPKDTAVKYLRDKYNSVKQKMKRTKCQITGSI